MRSVCLIRVARFFLFQVKKVNVCIVNRWGERENKCEWLW